MKTKHAYLTAKDVALGTHTDRRCPLTYALNRTLAPMHRAEVYWQGDEGRFRVRRYPTANEADSVTVYDAPLPAEFAGFLLEYDDRHVVAKGFRPIEAAIELPDEVAL